MAQEEEGLMTIPALNDQGRSLKVRESQQKAGAIAGLIYLTLMGLAALAGIVYLALK